MKYELHPACLASPPLKTEELRELADDIVANGLRDPVTLTPDGVLLDGRNRPSACGMVGVEPSTIGYRQRDGKMVTIGHGGEAKRYLASGEEDPEPLAGLIRPGERTLGELIERIADETPLTAADVAYARPRPEGIAAFNRARADWQAAARALDQALGGKDGTEWRRADRAFGLEGQPDDALWRVRCMPIYTEAGRAGLKNKGIRALVDAVEEASGWLYAAIANLAEAAP
jgi:hypothetical protein